MTPKRSRPFTSPAAQGIHFSARVTATLRKHGFRWEHQGGNIWQYVRTYENGGQKFYEFLSWSVDPAIFPTAMRDPVLLATYKISKQGELDESTVREVEFPSITAFLRDDPGEYRPRRSNPAKWLRVR